jgi:hypothetical protein
MSDTENPPPPDDPAAENKPARTSRAKAKIGEVIQIGEGRYALVVGTEKVRHQHLDANGEATGSVARDHPLIVDLPAPRRYELDHTTA